MILTRQTLRALPHGKTRPRQIPSLSRRLEKRDSAPILPHHSDSGILGPMKALLQDGRQAHMSVPPEKRLLSKITLARGTVLMYASFIIDH